LQQGREKKREKVKEGTPPLKKIPQNFRRIGQQIQQKGKTSEGGEPNGNVVARGEKDRGGKKKGRWRLTGAD